MFSAIIIPARKFLDVLLTLRREGIVTAERDDYDLSCRGNTRDIETRRSGSRNDRLRVVAWLWVVLLFVSVVATGCGGSSGGGGGDPYAAWGGMSEEEWKKAYAEKQEKERREAAEAKKAAEKRKAEDLAKRRAAQRKSGQASASRPMPPAPPGPSPASVASPSSPDPDLLPPLPLLPEYVADWKEGDLYIARAKGHPQLPTAVALYSKQTIGDEQAAAVLSSLLEPPSLTDWPELFAEPSRSSSPARRNRRNPEKTPPMLLIEAIADALGENRTPKARQTLADMIAGTIPSEHDRTAALAALRSLADHSSLDNEAVLLRLLVAPAEVRPAGRGDISAEELRTKAMEWVLPDASPWLRRKVAEHIVAPSTPQPERDLLGALTADLRPENLEAHAMLYSHHGTKEHARRALERHLATYSSEALGSFLGFPPPATKTPAGRDWPLRVTQQLWSDPSAERICRGLSLIGTLNDDGPLVSLASTIPSDRVRHTLYNTLEKHWQDGPRALRTAGLASDLLCEPGFLTVLKAIYREESLARRFEGSKPLHARPEQHAKLLKARQQRAAELDQDWQQCSRELLQAFSAQFRAAMLARARNTSPSARRSTIDPAAFPLDLHTDQSVFAVYHFDWPAEHRTIAGVPMDPLRVDYVRFEEKTRPVKVQGFYRRQLKACEAHALENGVWLDSLSSGETAEFRRSIDVLITCVSPDMKLFPDEEQRLVIEVFCVEIRDPVK